MMEKANQDDLIFETIKKEENRQKTGIELIPSENFVSENVLKALGSVLTNKYSEGYPNKRYYGGNEFIDIIEQEAIDRAKKLFNAEHVNVQPYSGSPANMEIYFALLNFNDKIMGMNLAHGGHLTHGHPVNFSGKAYQFIQYGVREDNHLIDYDEIRNIALKEKPKMIICGATAYSREIDFKKFADIAKEVDAISFADISHISGLIASGLHNSPFPHFDIVMSTTHKTLRGPRGAIIMCKEKFAKDIDKAVFPGMQGGPHQNAIAAKAIAFKEAMQPEFKIYSEQIIKNAKKLAEELIKLDFDVITKGTDNHLVLVDLSNKNITGKEAEIALDKAHITCNKNMVPYDKKTPFNPSGIRLGTPAITTRGMKEEDMIIVAKFINEVINNHKNEEKLLEIKKEVETFSSNFPLFKF
jgi:glycine hydroxymethyltransferase